MAQEKLSFEKAMARLEKIVEAIEQGKIELEDSIKQYEEGMTLIRHCRGVLSDAELRIQKLQAAGKDSVKTVKEGAASNGPQ